MTIRRMAMRVALGLVTVAGVGVMLSADAVIRAHEEAPKCNCMAGGTSCGNGWSCEPSGSSGCDTMGTTACQPSACTGYCVRDPLK